MSNCNYINELPTCAAWSSEKTKLRGDLVISDQLSHIQPAPAFAITPHADLLRVYACLWIWITERKTGIEALALIAQDLFQFKAKKKSTERQMNAHFFIPLLKSFHSSIVVDTSFDERFIAASLTNSIAECACGSCPCDLMLLSSDISSTR